MSGPAVSELRAIAQRRESRAGSNGDNMVSRSSLQLLLASFPEVFVTPAWLLLTCLR